MVDFNDFMNACGFFYTLNPGVLFHSIAFNELFSIENVNKFRKLKSEYKVTSIMDLEVILQYSKNKV